MWRVFGVVSLLAMPAGAGAQSALDCFGYQASALAIPEPWEAHTRTYANGAIRVTLMDLIEPAAGAFYLLVQTPPIDEMGNRSCAVIGSTPGGMGFANLFWQNIDASYDPARGLTVRTPVEVFAPATGGIDPAILAVTINQATGVISPVYELP